MILVSAFAGTTAYAEARHGATTTPPASGGDEQEGVIEPKADAELHKMSDYLASLKSFRVETTAIDEKFTTDGQKIQEISDSTIAVKRPGAMRVDRVGPRGHAVLRDDGRQISVINLDKNVYAEAPAPATIDEAIDKVRERLQIEAPGADLLMSDPYETLTDGLATGRYIGIEPIDNVKAHHLAVTKDNVDYQIWIQDGPEPVPLRYVITSKDMPGQPQFTVELRNWQPNATVGRGTFSFTAPPDAKRIDIKSAPKTPSTGE